MTMCRRTKFLSVAVSGLLAFWTASAEVTVNGLFSDHMVLQRGKPIAVFGTADSGEAVTVRLNNREAKTKTGKDGRFLVMLPAMQAGGPYTMEIAGEDNTIVINDVMLGEVWLCSGQSNMEWTMRNNTDGEELLKHVNNQDIRLFNVNRDSSFYPQTALNGDVKWQLCDSESAKNFSAVGYFFAEKVQRELGVVVGMINSSWSATRIEPWIASEAIIASNAELWRTKRELLLARQPGSEFQEQLLEGYFDQLDEWEDAASDAFDEKREIPAPPVYPWQLAAKKMLGDPSVIYNCMIAPLTPYSMAGFLWYQGEANLWDGKVYDQMMAMLVDGWRSAFKDNSLAFYFVQLAPHLKQANPDELPKMWEAQERYADSAENVGMVVINDIHSVNDIHPPDKRMVGARLANKALKYTYKLDVPNPDSPRLAAVTMDGSSMKLDFKNCRGLASTGGSAVFEIADDIGRWYPAQFKINGTSIIVSAQDVTAPTMVRYGWDHTAEANIVDVETGLPLGSFRYGELPPRGRVDALVPELKDYKLVYRFQPGSNIMSGDGFSAVYTIANDEPCAFSRIAYFVQLVKADGQSEFVAVDMDAFTDDIKKVGLPTVASGASFQCEVNNVKVTSNVPGIKNGFFEKGCNIEFFPGNYVPENKMGIPGASDEKFDFGDMIATTGVGYGSFQVHNYAEKQTLFAFNAWQNNAGADFGIGTNPDGNPDWTFTRSAGKYAYAYILVLVK